MSDYEMKLMDLDVEQLGIPVSNGLLVFAVTFMSTPSLTHLLSAHRSGAGVQLCGEDAFWGVCPYLPRLVSDRGRGHDLLRQRWSQILCVRRAGHGKYQTLPDQQR